jgi:AcrR family transcriptional regulator
LRREQILDASMTVFSRVSYREAATAAIASELGVSEPTLFRYFRTKRELYLATLDRCTEVIAGQWQEIIARFESPTQAIFALGAWYFAEIQTDARNLHLRFRSCGEVGDPDVAARVRTQVSVLQGLLRGLFEKARTAGEIAADTDTQAYAWLFMAVGALLDLTQIAGLRDQLPAKTIPSIMMLVAPEPGPACPPRAKHRDRP